MKKPMLQRSATEINKITGFIMGVRKFGKTSLWADMINAKFGDPEKGLLVSCGMEHGTNMIDNIFTTHANTWKDLVEVKEWLIKEKGNEHNVEMVCFDSAEEFFGIAESEIIRLSTIESGKKIKSIKAAYGGYTNGEKECAKLVKKFLNDLYNAGIVPWMIGHTKLKTVKDKASLDEEGFQRLGSSLIADYESAVADCFDIIATGLIDREIEEKGEGDSTKRYVKETERRLYFRGNEIVEAGGRLKDLSIPEYIPFDQLNMGKTFIDTIETALRNGRADSTSTKKPTVKKTQPVKKEVVESTPVEEDEIDDIDTPVDDIVDNIEETVENSDYPSDLDTVIRKMYKDCKDAELKASVKNVIAEYGKLNDVDEDGLKRIYDMMN
jgi:hypothetical protein